MYVGRIGGLLVQVMVFQAVMQLVSNFTGNRQPSVTSPQSPSSLPPDGIGRGPGGGAGVGGPIGEGDWPSGSPLMIPPNLNLHNYFPPDTPFVRYRERLDILLCSFFFLGLLLD